MLHSLHDTICALATSPGVSGLAVIRVSGLQAFSIVNSCFHGKKDINHVLSHTIHYGKFYAASTLVDTVTLSVFRAPHSYTGENTVEIGCHGGTIVSDLIISALQTAGCRMADAGEFTKRAFLNGKLDLTQVEAVADIIHASSQTASSVAARQLAGGFTHRIAQLRSDLLDICALLEIELDFSQEDIEFVDKLQMKHLLTKVRIYCSSLLDLHRSASIIRNGLHVGIVGYPNAGKSTLFNALIERQRAIVSNIPGTTRDYIEELTHIGSIAIKYFDTAGIRETEDSIEIEGIRFAESIMKQCDVLLVVNDATSGCNHSLPLFLRISDKYHKASVFYIQNKIDAISDDKNQFAHEGILQSQVLNISALTGEGIDRIRQEIASIAAHNADNFTDVLLNSRHASHLQKIISYLDAALQSAAEDMSNEFITIDVRAAIDELGMITGQVWSEDILNQIFSRFCIGK